MLFADPVPTATDYRRQARRIRASFSKTPLLRQQALVDLARRRNVQTCLPQRQDKTSVRRVVPVNSSTLISVVEHSFADHAALQLQPFGFTFSDRVTLLDSAERLGINRFRANMMLALLEHHTPARRFAAPEVPPRSLAPSLLVILGIEVAIICGLLLLAAL